MREGGYARGRVREGAGCANKREGGAGGRGCPCTRTANACSAGIPLSSATPGEGGVDEAERERRWEYISEGRRRGLPDLDVFRRFKFARFGTLG